VIKLDGFYLSEIILDVYLVLATSQRNQKLFAVFQEGVAEKCNGLRDILVWQQLHKQENTPKIYFNKLFINCSKSR
jgi:hypothetical protein